jgi:hypothetical protein
MTPTTVDYERLARTVLFARGDDPDKMETILGGDQIPAWEMEAIDEDNKLVDATADTLDNFRTASKNWREPGRLQEVNGGLYWERCQATKGQPRCELCVVDCGDFRLCYQV